MRIATLIMVAAVPAAAALGLTSESLHFTTASAVVLAASSDRYDDDERSLNRNLSEALSAAKFTGGIEQTFRKKIERNLGRPIDLKLANLGRLLWFDKLQSLGRDNSCGGCHSPTNGMAIRSPSPSVSRTTTWSVRIGSDRETSGERRRSSTRPYTRT